VKLGTSPQRFKRKNKPARPRGLTVPPRRRFR
jgi:hypothetical protein